ncbi:hypothetical protein BIY26_05125 [Brenneria goodwinii]|uniref:DUF2247 domain-containing protein n=1 Tax=Brenneria goodwinii TaxID=1109412 RepID=A0AAE8EQB8_9GAMM|nr:DUF2247 family protein [Brenneria goodwinii]ATA25830.1 hypothetical protein AWC36_17885 [Brenneria goodwinii]MCG8155934.1 DUF2247 family protein [Brenneria goodwinii]MCG8162327.1 DUF2247 family protein [Brenneria goodwinii]MCG8166952.1 DUF2247 family protein [Brenneria goodwinii]MCG8169626.1 DUF2247 family protein [Brenneria goodwinii]
MNLYPIPFDFIDKKTHLSWHEVKWGYENNLITSEVPIKKAEGIVLTGNYTDTELELSFIIPGQTDHIAPFLKATCSEVEQEDDSIIKQKWLFIVLSWLWCNRNNFDDPLGEIENIYADFDYPSEIEGFVKYMPPSDGYDPSAHTRVENINRLMNNWEEYLEKVSIIFKH